MRPFAFVVLALPILAAPPPGAAQTPAQPSIALTILAGAVTGHHLWTVAKQPLCTFGAGNQCASPPTYDTLRLSGSVQSSLVLGVAATYFPSPHVGLHAEMSYLGLPVDRGCVGLYFYADSENRNEQICDDIAGQTGAGGAISIFAGLTLRAAPQGSLSPYLRGSVGFVGLSRSTVEMTGGFSTTAGPQPPRVVIDDPDPRRTAPMAGLAAGITAPVGPGYQFRLEVRDQLVSLERVTGPADALATAPTASRFYHHLALTLGLDIVLERTRRRRY